jgi:hypothetical protein
VLKSLFWASETVFWAVSEAFFEKREKKVGKSFGGKKKVRTFALAIKQ